jgi:type I restriction enzyme R subunit
VLGDLEDRKGFVYQLARFVKAFRFLTNFFSFAAELREFAVFAEYIGPQLIKQGSVSDLMKQVRHTEVIKAAVEYQGVTTISAPVKLRPGKGKKGVAPPPQKISVQDMIDQIKMKFAISDEEALYIKEVTEEKSSDLSIRATVKAHREDPTYLDGTYRSQVNGEIQTAYNGRGRYEELGDPKYMDAGGIFDIMAVTVIQTHLVSAA